MAERRSRGDGGLHWDESRKRWIASVTLGFDGRGKRIVKKGSGRTKTEAKNKLKEVLRDHEDGLAIAPEGFTVANAVRDFLDHGQGDVSDSTKAKNLSLCENHVFPLLGAYKLRDLTAGHVDKWLADRAPKLSTRSLQAVHSILNRAIKRAMARDKVKRNVVALCSIPAGRAGRRSKSLTLRQVKAVLKSARRHRMYAYVVLALVTGARTEELRALLWDNVDLVGDPKADPPVPPHIAVWRSVRVGGDTKTRKSRRTLALSTLGVQALMYQREQQGWERVAAGDKWKEAGVVFATRLGGEMDASNVRRDFRNAIKGAPEINPNDWTPRELRHSFVSLLSDSGMSVDEISKLVGHSNSTVTEEVYRHQIRPVIQTGAVAMDGIFGDDPEVNPKP
ncbi:site-specific integrase [Yinghuangia aomiensis]|uniref:Site-specific integrase n=1 Tax=Yinghuangia aomiensis TaxID=676205 RepID=A0ABP9HU15_9ACTN